MAPHAASNWRRPYTSIYNDNYRYGTGLYSDTLTDIEKRYSESLSKTQLRSDRPDLTFATFSGSTLTSSPTPGGEISKDRPSMARQTSRSTSSPVRDLARSSSTFESRLNTALHSSYTLDEDVQDAINARIEQRKQRALAREESRKDVGGRSSSTARPKSLYDDATFWSLPKPRENAELDLETSRTKRKSGGGGILTTSNGPSSSQWREKSRLLHEQVETLENNMSSCGNKLQSELSSLKSKYHSEMSDLSRSVDLTSQQANDLQKLCKRQANQLLELQSAYDDSQRNVSDALEEVGLWQNKCNCIKKEMGRLREEIELAITRTSRS